MKQSEIDPKLLLDSVGLAIIPGGSLDRVDFFDSHLPIEIPIILTGSHHISKKEPSYENKESVIAKNHLLWFDNHGLKKNNSINEDLVYTDTKSVDHLSAVYYEQKRIEQILSGSKHKRLGVVTDLDNMRTFTHCLNWIIDPAIDIVPIPTTDKHNTVMNTYSKVLTYAWNKDLENVKGDVDLYMNEYHPYFADNPKPSNYAKLVKLFKLVDSAKSFLTKK